MKKKFKISNIVVFLVLLALAASMLYPLFFMIINSFKTAPEYVMNLFGLPEAFSLHNYQTLFDNFQILTFTKNSLIITATTIFLIATFASMAAFALTKLDFKFSKGLTTFAILLMTVPTIVLIIPVFQIMNGLNLINTYPSVILFYVASGLPFATYLLTTNAQSIPKELIEAAKIDGAKVPAIFFKIVLPLMRPSILTLIILNFLTYWNELIYSMLFLQTPEMRTLTVATATMVGKNASNMPFLLTGLLINSLPTLIIFLIFQKNIQKGMVGGAVK